MIEKFIESEANAKFKRWKKLARDARAVRKERATLMEGIHLMQVALESGCRVNAVLIDVDREAAVPPRPPTTPGSPPTRSISTVCRTRATRAR